MDNLKEMLEKIVHDYDLKLEKVAARHNTTVDSVWMFHAGVDSEGMPYSYGNYDDCYENGFDNGEKEGEYCLAVKILNIIQEAQKPLES